MKTAISVEDSLLGRADETARRMGLSRSRLFAVAMESFLRQRRDEEVTAQLNRVYGQEGGDADRRIASRIKSKVRSIVRDKW